MTVNGDGNDWEDRIDRMTADDGDGNDWEDRTTAGNDDGRGRGG